MPLLLIPPLKPMPPSAVKMPIPNCGRDRAAVNDAARKITDEDRDGSRARNKRTVVADAARKDRYAGEPDAIIAARDRAAVADSAQKSGNASDVDGIASTRDRAAVGDAAEKRRDRVDKIADPIRSVGDDPALTANVDAGSDAATDNKNSAFGRRDRAVVDDRTA